MVPMGTEQAGGGTRPTERRSQDFVDYERVAELYRRGRTLPAEVLDRSGRAVRPHIPPAALRVIDVGAGAGVFTRAWAHWARANVLAVEPAAAMIAAALRSDPGLTFVRACAEDLPLADASIDVGWISAALHHFSEPNEAAGELCRVLRRGGRALVRTYVPGRTAVSFAAAFPGRSKWESRFHDEEQLVALFTGCGFKLVAVEDVLEWTEPYAASADWASMMRHADSMLTALTDDEIATGLEALRSQPNRIGRLELTLLVFERR